MVIDGGTNDPKLFLIVDTVNNSWLVVLGFNTTLKVALQILGRKFYKNTRISSLYSPSLLIFSHKTPVVESHPTRREIRELLRPG